MTKNGHVKEAVFLLGFAPPSFLCVSANCAVGYPLVELSSILVIDTWDLSKHDDR